MIKINLLPIREKKKKKVRKEFFVLVFFLFVLEFIGLYYWNDSKASELTGLIARNQKIEKKINNLKKIKKKIEENKKNKLLLQAQNYIFEQLKYDKIGPPNMFVFFSYILTKKEDVEENKEELKKQEMAGWNIEWDPDSVWVTDLVEDYGFLTIKGQAHSHKDVAEFMKRMESGIFFYNIELNYQETKFDPILETHYVEYEIYCDINYNLEGYPSELVEQ